MAESAAVEASFIGVVLSKHIETLNEGICVSLETMGKLIERQKEVVAAARFEQQHATERLQKAEQQLVEIEALVAQLESIAAAPLPSCAELIQSLGIPILPDPTQNLAEMKDTAVVAEEATDNTVAVDKSAEASIQPQESPTTLQVYDVQPSGGDEVDHEEEDNDDRVIASEDSEEDCGLRAEVAEVLSTDVFFSTTEGFRLKKLCRCVLLPC